MVDYVGETSHTFSAPGYSSFLVGHGKDSERNEGFRPLREAFIQRAWKQSESLVLGVVPVEDFLHTKINNKGVYVDYSATEDIPEDLCSFRRQYSIMDGDLTALN